MGLFPVVCNASAVALEFLSSGLESGGDYLSLFGMPPVLEWRKEVILD